MGRGWRTAWFNHLLSSCDSCVHRLSYRTGARQQGQAGAKGSCSSQTPLCRALSLLIKKVSVSSAPPQLWLQGFMLHLPMYISILASSRRTEDSLLTSVLHFARCLSSEIPSQVMWPVRSSSQEISKGTLKLVLKHLIWNSCDCTLVSGAKLLWKGEKPYTWSIHYLQTTGEAKMPQRFKCLHCLDIYPLPLLAATPWTGLHPSASPVINELYSQSGGWRPESEESGNTINSNTNILPSTPMIWLHDSSILHFSVSLKSQNPVIKPGFMLLIKEKCKGTWTL